MEMVAMSRLMEMVAMSRLMEIIAMQAPVFVIAFVGTTVPVVLPVEPPLANEVSEPQTRPSGRLHLVSHGASVRFPAKQDRAIRTHRP